MAKTDANVSGRRDTDPSPLPIHVRGPDVLGEVGTAGKLLLTVVPAAGVAQRLPTGPRRTAPHRHAAVAVQQGRRGATAGRRALRVHHRAADTAEEGEKNKEKGGKKKEL